MIIWSAMPISRISVGRDGPTASSKTGGRKCKIQWFRWARKSGTEKFEKAKLAETNSPANGSKQSDSDIRESRQNSSLAPRRRWHAFAVKRMTEDERWDRDIIKSMEGTPQQRDPAKSGSAVFKRVSFDPLRQQNQIRKNL